MASVNPSKRVKVTSSEEVSMAAHSSTTEIAYSDYPEADLIEVIVLRGDDLPHYEEKANRLARTIMKRFDDDFRRRLDQNDDMRWVFFEALNYNKEDAGKTMEFLIQTPGLLEYNECFEMALTNRLSFALRQWTDINELVRKNCIPFRLRDDYLKCAYDEFRFSFSLARDWLTTTMGEMAKKAMAKHIQLRDNFRDHVMLDEFYENIEFMETEEQDGWWWLKEVEEDEKPSSKRGEDLEHQLKVLEPLTLDDIKIQTEEAAEDDGYMPDPSEYFEYQERIAKEIATQQQPVSASAAGFQIAAANDSDSEDRNV